MKTGTLSHLRRKARAVVQTVIDNNVFGPVQLLPKDDVLELRVKLREAYPFDWKGGWALKVYREEIRIALGYPPNRKLTRKGRKRFHERDVMPAMREWARQRGLLIGP